MLITPTLIPPLPVSWAASALRNPHPGAQTMPVSHSTPRGSWLVWEGDVIDVCHFDSVPADQCVRCKRMQAVKKNKSIFLKRRNSAHMPVSQSIALHVWDKRLYHKIHGPVAVFPTVCCYYCNTAKYASSVVSPCVFVVQYCTQMVQQTRLHNISNLHKTLLFLIDIYNQNASFCSMAGPRRNQTSTLVTHHDTVMLQT